MSSQCISMRNYALV